MKHEITNDKNLDAIKDNFIPPGDEHIREDAVLELFDRLQINFQFFDDYVYNNSETYSDGGKRFYSIKDISKVIRHLFNIESL